MSEAALVRFEGVSCRFGERVALDQLSWDIRAGEVAGLLGPNGAGKTTALRILCGLQAPTAGTVHIDGVNVATDPLAARRKLAFGGTGIGVKQRLGHDQTQDAIAQKLEPLICR